MIWWQLWKIQNDLVFQHRHISVVEIANSIVIGLRKFQTHQDTHRSLITMQTIERKSISKSNGSMETAESRSGKD